MLEHKPPANSRTMLEIKCFGYSRERKLSFEDDDFLNISSISDKEEHGQEEHALADYDLDVNSMAEYFDDGHHADTSVRPLLYRKWQCLSSGVFERTVVGNAVVG